MSFNCECQKTYLIKGSKVVCKSDNCMCICKFDPKECRSKECGCICEKEPEDCRAKNHNCICSNVKIDDKVNKCKAIIHEKCICDTNINLCKGLKKKYNEGVHHMCNCKNGICKAYTHLCICEKEPWSCRVDNSQSHCCSCLSVGKDNCKSLKTHTIIFDTVSEVSKNIKVIKESTKFSLGEEKKKKKKGLFCF